MQTTVVFKNYNYGEIYVEGSYVESVVTLKVPKDPIEFLHNNHKCFNVIKP